MEAGIRVVLPQQRMPEAAGAVERRKDSPLEPSEGAWPSWHLDFRLSFQDCEKINVLFRATKWAAMCYDSPGKLIQAIHVFGANACNPERQMSLPLINRWGKKDWEQLKASLSWHCQGQQSRSHCFPALVGNNSKQGENKLCSAARQKGGIQPCWEHPRHLPKPHSTDSYTPGSAGRHISQGTAVRGISVGPQCL